MIYKWLSEKKQLLLPLVIIVTGAALYGATLSFSFTNSDDNILIVQNFRYINDITNITGFFRSDVFNDTQQAYYRPLMLVSLMLDSFWGGVSAWPYHFTNIMLHIIASLLLFALLRRFGSKEMSFVMAMIFLVHPSLTQAVAWIPGRNDVLMAVFVIAAFMCFMRYCETGKPAHLFCYAIMSVLAVFSKESSFMLYIVSILYPLSFDKRFQRYQYVILSMFWAFLAFIWSVMRMLAFSNPVEYSMQGVASSLAGSWSAFLVYLGKALFPLNLSVMPVMADTSVIFGAVSLSLLVSLIWLAKNKNTSGAMFGLVWFVAFLLPSFVRPYPGYVADLLDHRLYLPMVGLFLTLSQLRYNISFHAGRKLLPVLILVLAVGTAAYSLNFSSPEMFSGNAVVNSSSYSRAHALYAEELAANGDRVSAERHYLKSLELSPSETNVRNNLAVLYVSRGDLKSAEYALREEIRLHPHLTEVRRNLAVVLMNMGRYPESILLFKEELSLSPGELMTMNLLASAYARSGDDLSAEKMYSRILGSDQGNISARLNLGSIYERRGDVRSARENWTLVLKSDPENIQAISKLYSSYKNESADKAEAYLSKLREMGVEVVQ